MITYQMRGKPVTRVDYGERQRIILAALAAQPWQTRRQLNEPDGPTILRMLARGLVKRRHAPSALKFHRFQIEYALASEPD